MTTPQQVATQESDERLTAVTTENIIDQEVFSRTGQRVGRVKDIIVDFTSQQIEGLLITDINYMLFNQEDVPSQFVIPYSWVHDADSIVITVPISSERVEFR